MNLVAQALDRDDTVIMTDMTLRIANWMYQNAFTARREHIATMNIPDSAKKVLLDQVHADTVELEMKDLQQPVHPAVLADLRRMAHRYQNMAGFDPDWLTFEAGDVEPTDLLMLDDAGGRHWVKPEGGSVWRLETDPSQERAWGQLLDEFGPARPRKWVGDV